MTTALQPKSRRDRREIRQNDTHLAWIGRRPPPARLFDGDAFLALA